MLDNKKFHVIYKDGPDWDLLPGYIRERAEVIGKDEHGPQIATILRDLEYKALQIVKYDKAIRMEEILEADKEEQECAGLFAFIGKGDIRDALRDPLTAIRKHLYAPDDDAAEALLSAFVLEKTASVEILYRSFRDGEF